jgi:hypothetical protein
LIFFFLEKLKVDKVYQLLAHGWWFSPCIPASSTTKTGRHDIAEILLKVVLNTKNQSRNLIKYVIYYRASITKKDIQKCIAISQALVVSMYIKSIVL